MRATKECAVFVCYVPGLDLRRIPPGDCPSIAGLLASSPWVRIRGLPDTEHVPTILTGVYPHEHGVWQLRLLSAEERSPPGRGRLVHRLPDLLTTTVQGIAHALTKSMDLATMPPHRRHRFALHRFKYERREGRWSEPSRRTPSLFQLLGQDSSRYTFCRRFGRLGAALRKLPTPSARLDFFELYAFDLTQHWNLDRQQAMRDALRRVDEAVERLRSRCAEEDRVFLLLSDHGQEPVRGRIDLMGAVAALDVTDDEYAFYLQVPSARFWFSTDRAREAILEMLEALPHTRVLGYRELHRYGVRFPSGAYGEVYAFAEPGHVFFPHDFYHPLANLFLGLSDPQQRPRLRDPVHRGCHGYLPEAQSEVGFLLVAEEGCEATRQVIELVDVAPTILSLLGVPQPDRMTGSSAFAQR